MYYTHHSEKVGFMALCTAWFINFFYDIYAENMRGKLIFFFFQKLLVFYINLVICSRCPL